MESELTNQGIELERCEVCGDASWPHFVVPDLYYVAPLDGGPWRFERRQIHRFCAAHNRPGKTIEREEPQAAYFARLRATQGDIL